MPLTGPVSRAVDVSKASSWDEMRRITDKYLPRWIRTLLNGFEKAKAGTSVRALIRLLEGEEFDAVVDEIDWIPIDGPRADTVRMVFPVLLREVMESTAASAVGVLDRNPKVRVVGAFDVTNPLVNDWIRSHSAELVTQISAESKQAIRDLVARAYSEGIPPASLGRMIRSSIGLTSRQARAVANLRARMMADGKKAEMIDKAVERYAARLLRRRAEMIARTELMKAETQGQLELWRQQAAAGNIDGSLAGVEWIITDDDRLCEQCMELEGVIVGLGESFPGGVDGSPLHPNCFSGDAVVAASGVSAYFKRWFEGEVVVVSGAGIADLTVTPNHPILTSRGWRAAGSLELGDELVQCLDPRAALADGHPHDDYIESRFEDVASSAAMSGGVATCSVPMAAEDFHGDGTIDHEVYVVRPARDLSINGESGREKAGTDAPFGGGKARGAEALLSQNGRAGEGLVGAPTSTNSLVSGADQSPSFTGRCPRHPGEHRLTRGLDRETEPHPGPSNSEAVATDSPSYIHARLAGHVQNVKVTGLVRRQYSAHVYNLETREGWYLANGIIAHNCRCTVALVPEWRKQRVAA